MQDQTVAISYLKETKYLNFPGIIGLTIMNNESTNLTKSNSQSDNYCVCAQQIDISSQVNDFEVNTNHNFIGFTIPKLGFPPIIL